MADLSMDSRLPGRAASTLGTVNALLPLTSILLYFVVRNTYDTFYGRFGVTPEEVGITQAAIISRAAFGLGLLIAITIALLSFWIPFLIPARDPSAWRGFLLATLMAVAATLIAWPLDPIGGLAGLLLFTAASYGVRTFWLFERSRERRPAKANGEAQGKKAQRFHTAVLPLLGLGVILLALILLVVQQFFTDSANSVADKALRQEAEETGRGALLGGLGIHAPLVDVTWTGKAPTGLENPDQLVYLGQADGIATFFDSTRQQTLRVPTGSFVLTMPQSDED